MRRAVAHVFVDDLDRPVLTEKDVHHFSRVLRLRPEETVSVADGRGGSQIVRVAGRRPRPSDRADLGTAARATAHASASLSPRAITPSGPFRS